ncbi:DnaT-like ssDNA-binding protein [Roseibium aggregatum]|uniref:Putative DnaT-like domain-containing protein n=1 Tax=Roseibium aggregatum TaxID=187304 RepID=A0A0M6Y6N1_9HYPH|nr:DnaT-like ssDNA-binding protein [Roseibium aggregatum]CTQ45766.1 hypothetical protein LAL4801_04221 [Roseibium aggregatum]
MAFDATVGGPDATSYASTDEADDFFADRNAPAWNSASFEDQEAALSLATDYLETEYIGRWAGSIASPSQRLSHPRRGVVDPEGRAIPANVIPEPVKRATFELAVLSLSGEDLFARNEDDARVLEVEETVGPITTKTKYQSAVGISRIFPQVERFIRPLLSNRRGKLVRT